MPEAAGRPGQAPGKGPSGPLPKGGFWASGTCGALYTVRPAAEEGKSDPAYGRAALKAFAERSARDHECGPVQAP
ncbi:hypothetical protein [Streptomyces sp. NPDC050504]|uniref:hypothetical protein n=1 Tax=Streptomyces sp. NPDC050504 TaxID=3365618 RepID=UPI00379248C5